MIELVNPVASATIMVSNILKAFLFKFGYEVRQIWHIIIKIYNQNQN